MRQRRNWAEELWNVECILDFRCFQVLTRSNCKTILEHETNDYAKRIYLSVCLAGWLSYYMPESVSLWISFYYKSSFAVCVGSNIPAHIHRQTCILLTQTCSLS